MGTKAIVFVFLFSPVLQSTQNQDQEPARIIPGGEEPLVSLM